MSQMWKHNLEMSARQFSMLAAEVGTKHTLSFSLMNDLFKSAFYR